MIDRGDVKVFPRGVFFAQNQTLKPKETLFKGKTEKESALIGA
jgi:hypothetical protein